MAQFEIKFAKFRPYQINFKIFDVKLTKHEQNFALPNNLTSDLSQFEIKYGQLLMASFRILLGGQAPQLPTQKEYCAEGANFYSTFLKKIRRIHPILLLFSPSLNDYTSFFFSKTVILMTIFNLLLACWPPQGPAQRPPSDAIANCSIFMLFLEIFIPSWSHRPWRRRGGGGDLL